MSDSVGNEGSDVEALESESLLGTPAEFPGSPETEITNFNAAQAFIYRSTELLTLAVKCGAEITSQSSSASGYDVLECPDCDLHNSSPSSILARSSSFSVPDLELAHQDSGIAAISVEIPEELTQDNTESQRIQREDITEIVRKKKLQALHGLGGVTKVAEALGSDLEKGISCPQEIVPHRRIQLCQLLVTFFHSLGEDCSNCTIFLLSLAACFSLGFGIKEEGWHFGWLDGTFILLTIFVIVSSTAIKRCWEEWQNSSQSSQGRNILVKVVREGSPRRVRECDLEVGDIAVLGKGDQVPADGLLLPGKALEIDQGSTTSTTVNDENPFLFYGSRVINGIDARMLVTHTGKYTVWGAMMSQTMQSADNKCKFESRLHKLNRCINVTGLIQSILIIIVLFIRYKLGKLADEKSNRPDSKGEPTKLKAIFDAIKGILTNSSETARALIASISLSLVGTTEGTTFAISVATVMWSRKILAHKAMESDFLACIKMASVTTICAEIFGGPTADENEIDKLYVGEEFVSESSVVSSNVLEDLCDGIGTLHLQEPHTDCESKVVTLVSWAEVRLGLKRASTIEQCKMIGSPSGHNPFQERCQVVVVKNGNEGYHLHCRGPPPDILSLCSSYYDIGGATQALDDGKMRRLREINERMKGEEADVIAYAYKRINNFEVASAAEPSDLIFIGMISLKETRTEDTKRAISALTQGEITTIIASGNDDIAGLKTIGENCGILTPDSDNLVLLAEEFRDWSDEERKEKVGKIRILGNCLPSDKILLVKCLREKGQVVAFLGQRTMDAPALKQAHIGLAFGTWSSTVARECCDICIGDGNCFSFLKHVIENGRCFLENIRKFVQMQLIFTSSSSMIDFAATVFWGDAPVTAVQLFWLNLVVPLCGGLALLTGQSTKAQMSANSSQQLITKAMWRNILFQASYQITIFLTLQLKGDAILRTTGDILKSMVYNGFFLCQVFNTLIAREPEKNNISSGLFHKNWWFWVGLTLLLICQAVSAVAEQALGSSPALSWELWGTCSLIGLLSWPLDCAGKAMIKFH